MGDAGFQTRGPLGLDPGGPRTPTGDPSRPPSSDMFSPPGPGGWPGPGSPGGAPGDWQNAMVPVQAAGGVSGSQGPGGAHGSRGPAPSMAPVAPKRGDSAGDLSAMGPKAPRSPKRTAADLSQSALPKWHPQYLVAIVEMIKIIDWFTELMKVTAGEDAAGDYYPWAIFTLAMACWLLLHRAFDQVGLYVLATGWAGEYLCALMCSTCLVAFPFFPLANLTFCLYRKEHPNAVQDERAVFAQRPLSTIMLGLPFSGVMSMLMAPAELVMHPVQVHIRAMQAMYQTIFLNIPDFIIDLIVILNAEEDTNVGWFYVSFFYSVIELGFVCLMTVGHIHEAEKKKPAPKMQHGYR